MEIVWFTLVAGGLYFFSDWLLDFIERARGRRLVIALIARGWRG